MLPIVVHYAENNCIGMDPEQIAKNLMRGMGRATQKMAAVREWQAWLDGGNTEDAAACQRQRQAS